MVVVRSIAPAGVVRDSRVRDLVLWVGADKPVKRPWLFEELVRSAPQSLRYVMVGKGLEPKVAVPGNTPEVRAALGHADLLDLIADALVVVNTSEVEGFPNVFLEAWSRGVPILSLGADPDGVVSRLETGWVCRTTEEAATVLARLARDPEEALERGARAVRYVAERHSTAASVQAVSALLAEAAHVAAARRGAR